MDALDTALTVLRDSDHIELATHGPMAAEALVDLGFADRVPDWATAYRGGLARIPNVDDALPQPDSRAHLGRRDLRGAFIRHFDDEIRAAGWRAVARRWLPRLLPGSPCDAAHGPIRTGHALRSLGHRESPERRHELAEAFAYWASSYEELPGAPGSAASSDALPSEVIRGVPTIPVALQSYGGLITERLRMLEDVPGFAPAVSALRVGEDVEAFANDLALTAARLCLANSERTRVIDFIHALDGVTAIRELLPFLSPTDARHALFYGWQIVAALHASAGKPWEEVPSAEHARQQAPAADEVPALVHRAVEIGGAHAIKFAQACLHEYALQPDPIFHAALADVVERMEILKERLGLVV